MTEQDKLLRTFAPLVVVLALLVPATATADSITKFRARDAGSRIHLGITVCTDVPHTIRFYSSITPENGWPIYRANYRGSQQTGCDRWTLGRDDIFAEGIWTARLKVAIGGRIFTTRWREFFID